MVFPCPIADGTRPPSSSQQRPPGREPRSLSFIDICCLLLTHITADPPHFFVPQSSSFIPLLSVLEPTQSCLNSPQMSELPPSTRLLGPSFRPPRQLCYDVTTIFERNVKYAFTLLFQRKGSSDAYVAGYVDAARLEGTVRLFGGKGLAIRFGNLVAPELSSSCKHPIIVPRSLLEVFFC